jgi:hypothetical protein
MQIGEIVRQAWAITFKYKSLWVFGLFIEGFAAGQGFMNKDHFPVSKFNGFEFSPMLITLIFIGVIVGLVVLVLHFIATAGLIDAVNRITRGGEYKFSAALSSALGFFWRFVGLALVLFFFIICLMLIIILPEILVFLVSTILGFFSLLIALPALLFAAFVSLSIYALAQRAIVARNCSISDAITEAYWLFRRNLGQNLAIFLINIGIAIAVGMCVILLLLIIAAPFIALALTSTTGIIVAIAVGLPIVLFILLLSEGISGSFKSSLYTLFYFELVEPKVNVVQTPPPIQPLA